MNLIKSINTIYKNNIKSKNNRESNKKFATNNDVNIEDVKNEMKKLIINFIKFILKKEYNYYYVNFHIHYIQSYYIYKFFFNEEKKNILSTDINRNISNIDAIDEKYFNDKFNTFVNYLIFFICYKIKIVKQKGSQDPNIGELYNGETYKISKKDIPHTESDKVRMRYDNLVLLENYNPEIKLHLLDLTTYQGNFEEKEKEKEKQEYKTTLENMKSKIPLDSKEKEKEELIRKLRNALLTNNFKEVSQIISSK
jgi:hypothetical protein